MMHSRLRLLTSISALLLVVFLAGCNHEKKREKVRKQVEKEIGHGVLASTTYTNDYFNLKIEFPKSWHIASKAEKKELNNAGKNMMKASARNSPAMDASLARTLNLATAFKHPPGTPNVGYNSNFAILAERVKHLPGIKTGADYLHHAKKTMQTQMRLRTSFQPIETGSKIGSLSADCLPVEISIGPSKVQQRIYATRVKDYVLVVILNYESPSDREILMNLLRSMQASK